MLSVPRSGVRRRSDGLVGIGRVLAHRVLPPVSWRHKIGGSVARRRSQAAYRIGPKSADERQDRKTPQLKRFSQETDKVHMGAWATMRPHVDTGRPLRIGRSCSGCRLREPARSGKGRGVGCRGFRFDDRRGVLPCRPWSRRGPSWIASSDVRASTAVLSWGIQWFTAYPRSVVRILFWCLIYMDISLVGCVFTASI